MRCCRLFSCNVILAGSLLSAAPARSRRTVSKLAQARLLLRTAAMAAERLDWCGAVACRSARVVAWECILCEA